MAKRDTVIDLYEAPSGVWGDAKTVAEEKLSALQSASKKPIFSIKEKIAFGLAFAVWFVAANRPIWDWLVATLGIAG